jgi:hypothetical protein
MLVNPNYRAGGSAPSTVLPEMNGIKYFYDLTNISAGGDIEVPNALVTVEPLVLHSATATDNAIQLTGEANGSYGTFNVPEIVGTSTSFIIYCVYKIISLGAPNIILDVIDTNSAYTYGTLGLGRSGELPTVTTTILRQTESTISEASSSVLEVSHNFGVIALVRYIDSSAERPAVFVINNVVTEPSTTQQAEYVIHGYPSANAYSVKGSPTGEIRLCSIQNGQTGCTVQFRAVAVADVAQSPTEIAANLAYLQKHYVETYNA